MDAGMGVVDMWWMMVDWFFSSGWVFLGRQVGRHVGWLVGRECEARRQTNRQTDRQTDRKKGFIR